MKYLRLQLLLLLSVVVGLGSFAQETNKPDWRQLHYLSQEEMEAGLNNRLTNFTATAAPTGTVRFPGEFEPMQAVMVRYPLGVPTSFIKTLAEECKVITLVSSSSLSAARNAYNNAGVNMDNCEFVTISTDSYWVRDYCPWYIFVNKSPAIVDFRYNRERESDDIAPVSLAENYFNIPWYGMDVTHTGGNMMQDGRGFGMSDDLVVTESAQYSNIDENTIKQRMNDYLGIDNYLITDDPQGLYIAHIDCWGKLLAPDKILIAKMPETDSRYQNYEDIANYFENTNCCWGYPYKVYRVNEFSSSQNATLAPYTNSLILNNRVFVPLGSNTTYNNNALAVYREAMPGYTVIGVASNSSYAWQNTDALHCRTRGVMDFEMLFVDHRNVIHGEQELQDSYAVTSTFIPYSGKSLIPAQTVVYYRINGGEWQTSPMTATTKDDEYTGYITGCTYGATVEYYVSATDESGHTSTQPVMGASDPHSFTIKDAPTTYTITATADPEAGGTITGAGVYNENDNVVLTATPVGSYVFVNWTDNGDEVSSNATYSFNAERDRNLVAHFESTLYWTPVSGNYENNVPLTAIIQIDGVEQFTDALEVGVFCGDECRGSAVGELFPFNNKYILNIIFFGDPGEEYSFRLYDHSTATELTPTTLNAPANITYNADGYGNPVNPYVLNFTSVIQEYTVTVTASPAEGGEVTGGGTFETGEEATVTATANTGYTFFNWSVDGHTVSTEAEYTFTVNANQDLTANFNLNTYNITVNVNPAEGGTVTGAGTYNHGASVTLTATANENYRFIGWMENGEVISQETTLTFTAEADRVLTAKFSSTLYWTATPGDSENNMTMSAYILIDDVEQFGNTLEVGVFVGDECRASAIGVKPPFSDHYILSLLIYGDPDESFSFRLYDHTAEAELTPDLVAPADVTFNENGYGSPVHPYPLNFTSQTPEYTINVEADPVEGGSVAITGENPYLQNTEVTVTATPNTGYAFVNWMVGEEEVSTDAEFTFHADADKTLVAHFELIEYTVTVTANPAEGGTAAITEEGPYHYNDVINLTHTENTGYEFVNFTVNGTEVTSPYTVTDDVEIVANFQLLSYEVTVTAEPTNGGTVDGAGTFEYGTEVTVTASPEQGYTFVNWTEEGTQVSTNANYSFTITEAHNLVANFSLNNYVITAEANPTEGGTVSGSGGFDYGQTCTLTATANAGYTFNNWTKDDVEVSTATSYEFTVTETATYVAHFTQIEYTVTVTADATAGTAAITEEGPYHYNDVINLTHTENTGYEFVNFTVNGEEITSPYTVTDNVEIVANFQLLSYEVTVTANPAEGGVVTGSGTYNHGDEITATANANNHYEFVNWTVNGEEVTMPYTVTEAVEIVANFELITTDHEFSFTSGWNWWSTYIEMNGVQGLQLLENALGSNGVQIKGKNAYVMHSGNSWLGQLKALNNESMYQIKVNADGEYSLNGIVADPSEHTISLTNGWNWVGYIENTVMATNDALVNLAATDEDIFKSYFSFTTYYEGFGWWGDLEELEPGVGYMLQSSGANSFTYPVNAKTSVHNSQPIANKYWNPVVGQFPNNMNVIAVVELDGNELRSENVELAAFADNGECRGSALLRYVEPIDRYVAFLTVYGDDEDALNLRVRYQDASYAVNEQLTMMTDEVVGTGRNPFTMTAKGAGLNEISASLNFYPNPVGQGQEVKIELPENMGNATVEIIDVMGRTICRNTFDGGDGACTVSTPDASGVYTIRVINEQGQTWNGKLIVK
jgi:uncharacterized repeat protein (TIGR02543 family)